MNKIVVGNYNNYYNRIHKPALAVEDNYLNVGALLPVDRMYNAVEFRGINFNRGDGINATLTMNVNPTDEKVGYTKPTFVYNKLTEQTTAADIQPDYLLVCEDVESLNAKVLSRWFILESHWTREWQFVLVLRRDLIADMWGAFKDEEFYCEKGPIPTGFDIAKYNSEGMTFNQVLKSRTYLKPYDSDKRYFVAYLDRGWAGGSVYPGGSLVAEFPSWDSSPFRKCKFMGIDGSPVSGGTRYISSNINRAFELTAVCMTTPSPLEPQSGQNASMRAYTNKEDGEMVGSISDTVYSAFGAGILNSSSVIENAAKYVSRNMQTQDEVLVEAAGDIHIDYEEISYMNNKTIKVGNNYYTVVFTQALTQREVGLSVDDPTRNLAIQKLREYCAQHSGVLWLASGYTDFCTALEEFTYYTVAFTTVTADVVDLPNAANRDHVGSMPYDICYAEDGEYAKKFFANLAAQFIDGNVVYDIQFLPFKPDDGVHSTGIGGTEVIHWVNKDYKEGTFIHGEIAKYTTNTDYKVGSNLHMCRLYGPDGASAWDFNPAKIGGVAANSIKYEVTFAPMRPYIHIFPTFNNLYGAINKTAAATPNEGEPRGLICSGDYSIPYSTSNWARYQLQNSAYQLSHDRQIENMSISQDAERMQERLGAAAGTVSGAFSGAQSGMMMGGPIGAAIGGVVGGVGSLAAGAAGFNVNERLRAEELSYAEDMFGYALRNIKAQAQPLAHSNYITIGVATFPYIELYKAEDKEEEIFTKRLKVNGWSLGIVTKMSAMKTAATAHGAPTQFVNGRLVKFDGAEDAHVAAEIDRELQRGVRFLES